MPDWLNSLTARVAQDLITSGAAYLAAHGFITQEQTQGFIGAVFFLVMLLINTVLHAARAADNQIKGATNAMQNVSVGAMHQ